MVLEQLGNWELEVGSWEAHLAYLVYVQCVQFVQCVQRRSLTDSRNPYGSNRLSSPTVDACQPFRHPANSSYNVPHDRSQTAAYTEDCAKSRVAMYFLLHGALAGLSHKPRVSGYKFWVRSLATQPCGSGKPRVLCTPADLVHRCYRFVCF
ncbi:hypothetical protein BDV09DRAFT_43271 [Aspergillus tetrazonus]